MKALDKAIRIIDARYINNIEIKSVKGHYEAYENGKFICSGDTIREVEEDLREMGYK